jgi:hypothetical protein
VAASLRREIGQEVEAAEARVRAEVNGHIQPLVQDARSRVASLRSGMEEQVLGATSELEALEQRLRERIDALTRGTGLGADARAPR